ncbi:nucleotidyltransferase family protein [Tenacibaculum sp. 190524A05c]|uniref:nucleotidyltransferase family protein n=1 Tax=Tenacibaculum platacis TaxID=3137852 RepID=UPI0031FA756B
MKVATLVLAAGKSTRMGSPKQLLKLGNTTLLGKVIESVCSIPNNSVFCVLGANADLIEKSIESYDITTVRNKNYDQGLSSSIIAGIQHVSELDVDLVLIVLGDQPKIESEYLKLMIQLALEKKDSIITSRYQKRNGVPAIFPKKYFKNLLNLQGDKGASKLLNSEEFPIYVINESVDLVDIDTQDDYQNLLNNGN